MLRVFPVDLAARPTFSDTFGAPRPGGRVHEGTDIFAPEATEVYAVDAGRVVHQSGSIGGLTAVLLTADTHYVYSHLSAYEGGQRRVNAGELIGRVGHTGNAANTPPHLHFEIHPLDGAAINPFEALRAARDATLHPPPVDEPSPPSPATSPATSSAPPVDGIAVVLLLLWGLREMDRRQRWRLN